MRGPATGYNFGNKRHYRRMVWKYLEGHATPKPIKSRHVFILDSKEAGETLFLLQRGYRPENIHVCNDNAAEVATVQLRVKNAGFGRVDTHGVDAVSALERIKKDGIALDSINLDFCSNAHTALLTKLQDIRGLLPDSISVAVTLLRGREVLDWKIGRDSYSRQGLSPIEAGNAARIRMITGSLQGATGSEWSMCLFHTLSPRVEEYVSGDQRMMVLLFELRTHRHVISDQKQVTALRQQYLEASRNPKLRPWVPPCVVIGQLHNPRPFDDLVKEWREFASRNQGVEAFIFPSRWPDSSNPLLQEHDSIESFTLSHYVGEIKEKIKTLFAKDDTRLKQSPQCG
jgi:hypothetical protein